MTYCMCVCISERNRPVHLHHVEDLAFCRYLVTVKYTYSIGHGRTASRFKVKLTMTRIYLRTDLMTIIANIVIAFVFVQAILLMYKGAETSPGRLSSDSRRRLTSNPAAARTIKIIIKQ